MIDFSAPTDQIYEVFGVTATYYADADAEGAEVTVLFELFGTDGTGYGQSQIAKICVRRSEVSSPEEGYAHFEIDGTTWKYSELMGADEGTNELELAMYCVANSRFGVET